MISCLRLARVLVAILSLAALNLGCDRSTGQWLPVGPSAPSPPQLNPLRVLSVAPNSGPPDVHTEIRITGAGFEHAATLTLDGLAATIREVSDTLIVATTPIRAPGTVDVIVTNPSGQSARLSGGYTFGVFTVTASPLLATFGETLAVSWEASGSRPTHGGGDWISLFRVGDPDSNWGWFRHLDGANSGTMTMRAPSQPGEYEFRYMVDHYAVARSGPVKISASASQ